MSPSQCHRVLGHHCPCSLAPPPPQLLVFVVARSWSPTTRTDSPPPSSTYCTTEKLHPGPSPTSSAVEGHAEPSLSRQLQADSTPQSRPRDPDQARMGPDPARHATSRASLAGTSAASHRLQENNADRPLVAPPTPPWPRSARAAAEILRWRRRRRLLQTPRRTRALRSTSWPSSAAPASLARRAPPPSLHFHAQPQLPPLPRAQKARRGAAPSSPAAFDGQSPPPPPASAAAAASGSTGMWPVWARVFSSGVARACDPGGVCHRN